MEATVKNNNTVERQEALKKLSQVLDDLELALQQFIQNRRLKQFYSDASHGDQVEEHSVPAARVNDSCVRRILPNDDSQTMELGREWARKYNPHYKR